jgi:hypothetical protein
MWPKVLQFFIGSYVRKHIKKKNNGKINKLGRNLTPSFG